MARFYFGMVWLSVALSIPIILLITGYLNYARRVEVWKIIARLSIAFLGYVLTTSIGFVWTFAYAIGAGGAHVKPSHGIKDDIFYIIFFLVYMLGSWLLISLAKGSFIKPWKHSKQDGGKNYF